MTPKLYKVDKEEKKIYMEYLKDYVSLKSHLGTIKDNFAQKVTDLEEVIFKLGESIAKLHNNSIIHGDLTSSNIMVNLEKEEKVYIIDFGLSSISDNVEN